MSDRVSDGVEIRIPSQLRFLSVVDAVVQTMARELGWDADEIGNLGTAAIEAAANAIEHGNAYSDRRSVLIRVRSGDSSIEIEVEDEGAGFDARPFEREMSSEDLLKLRGRGIFIMRSFVGDVTFSRLPNGGTRVRMRKEGKAAVEGSGQTSGS